LLSKDYKDSRGQSNKVDEGKAYTKITAVSLRLPRPHINPTLPFFC